MSDTHKITGYAVCTSCREELVLDVISKRTGGLCPQCFADRNHERIAEIEIIAHGSRITVPTGKKKRKKKRAKTPQEKARQRVVDRCKERARKRLAVMFADLYDILLAEERAAAGLDPWPLDRALRHGPDPDGSQTEDFAAVYHALQERGVDA